jgi:cytochrome c oxidase cbb3-type subunit III
VVTSTKFPVGWRLAISLIAIATILSAGAKAAWYVHVERLQAELLSVNADAVTNNTHLVDFARKEGARLFANHCARCHGEDLRGNTANGAVNLTDAVWLYESGSVFDIERTVLYGIRSGMSKARNVTDMPPYGITGRLSEAEIRNLVQYLLKLSGQQNQSEAAMQGRALYYDVAKANCVDCHGDTALGNPNYGAPDLTKNVWNNGGDAKSLYESLYNGRHRIMPGFIGTLSLAEIRAVSVYVYLASHP